MYSYDVEYKRMHLYKYHDKHTVQVRYEHKSFPPYMYNDEHIYIYTLSLS